MHEGGRRVLDVLGAFQRGPGTCLAVVEFVDRKSTCVLKSVGLVPLIGGKFLEVVEALLVPAGDAEADAVVVHGVRVVGAFVVEVVRRRPRPVRGV